MKRSEFNKIKHLELSAITALKVIFFSVFTILAKLIFRPY